MRITDLLKKQGITLSASPKDKQEAIDILVKLHEKCGNLKDTAAYWSPFGQAVILLLIQIGGLGVVTVASFIEAAAGKKLSEG